MAKGGRGSLRPSYGQPKLTLISRFVAMQIRCYEKLTLFYFWSDRFETNRKWGHFFHVIQIFLLLNVQMLTMGEGKPGKLKFKLENLT